MTSLCEGSNGRFYLMIVKCCFNPRSVRLLCSTVLQTEEGRVSYRSMWKAGLPLRYNKNFPWVMMCVILSTSGSSYAKSDNATIDPFWQFKCNLLYSLLCWLLTHYCNFLSAQTGRGHGFTPETRQQQVKAPPKPADSLGGLQITSL